MPNGAAQNVNGALYVDTFLTNYSVNWLTDNSQFIAGAASTLIPVMLQSGKYVTFDRGYFLRDEMALKPLGGRPEQVSYKLGEGVYSASHYALEHVIDDEQRANVAATRQINLDMNATRLLTGKSLIKRDRVWSTSFFKTGTWTFDMTGVGSAPGTGEFLQFDQTGATPIETIDEAIDAIAKGTGFKPNTLILGTKVRRILRTQADISDRIKYVQIGIADEDLLKSLFFGNDPNAKVMTARSIYNAAAEGQANNFVWNIPEDAFWLGYVERTPALDSPTAIARFAWTGLFGGAGNDEGGVITRGREDRATSDWFQIHDAWDIRQISPDLGAYFASAVS